MRRIPSEDDSEDTLTLDRLGIERGDDTEVLGDTMQKKSRHPQLIAHRHAFDRTHLEFPLNSNASDERREEGLQKACLHQCLPVPASLRRSCRRC